MPAVVQCTARRCLGLGGGPAAPGDFELAGFDLGLASNKAVMEKTQGPDLPSAGAYGFALVEKPARIKPSVGRLVGVGVSTVVAATLVYIVVALLAGAIAGEVCAVATEVVGLLILLRLSAQRGPRAGGR